MTLESSRPNKHSPRYEIDALVRYSPDHRHFCQQVGQYDVWLLSYEVWMVSAPRRNETLGQIQPYTYKHAAMRFPAIEHKIYAMRAMLFGGRYAADDNT